MNDLLFTVGPGVWGDVGAETTDGPGGRPLRGVFYPGTLETRPNDLESSSESCSKRESTGSSSTRLGGTSARVSCEGVKILLSTRERGAKPAVSDGKTGAPAEVRPRTTGEL